MEAVTFATGRWHARYPQVPVRPVALISQYDDLADMILNDVSDALRVG